LASKAQQKGWKKVFFGDVVRNVKDNVDPQTCSLERYIAGEHMQSEDIHLRQWGIIGDDYLGPAFHRKFTKGQVLYGSRRTYLKKVALADFDGITANTTFVLEPQDNSLLTDLLPFIMLTDKFTEHSVRESKGSVNPYINWKDIAKYEFPLPPKDEQRRIADVLWSADEANEYYITVKDDLNQLIDSVTTSFLSKSWSRKTLDSLLYDIQYGTSNRISEKTEESVPVLRIPNVIGGKLDLSDLGWIVLRNEEKKKYKLDEGDLLIVRTNGNPEYVGRTAVVKRCPKDTVYASYLIRLKCDSKLLHPEYLHAVLQSSLIKKTLRHEIRSSAGNYNLNTQGIKRQNIPLPPVEIQESFVDSLLTYQIKSEEIQKHIEKLKNLKATLINELLLQ